MNTPVPTDEEASLVQLVSKGRSRRDDDRSVMEELGFRVGMWNRAQPAGGLDIRAGLHAGNLFGETVWC